MGLILNPLACPQNSMPYSRCDRVLVRAHKQAPPATAGASSSLAGVHITRRERALIFTVQKASSQKRHGDHSVLSVCVYAAISSQTVSLNLPAIGLSAKQIIERLNTIVTCFGELNPVCTNDVDTHHVHT